MSWWTGSPAAYRSPAPRADARGFTLVEVLVAGTVAALLLVAVLRILSLGLDGSERSAAYTQATLLAESTLDALGAVSPLVDGEATELENGRFHVRAAVERYREPGAPSGDGQYLVLYRLSTTVSWREAGRNRAVSLATLRLGPPR